MECSATIVGFHKGEDVVSYGDRNDGFERTHFSRSKNNNARIHKVDKIVRKKHGHKAVVNHIY